MSIEVSPVRVSRRRPSGRHAAVVFVAALALVVSVGVLGQTRAPKHPAPTPAASVGAAVARTSPSTTPLPAASVEIAYLTPAPTSASVPTPTPIPTPREGAPTVTSTSASLLSEPRWLVRSGVETLSADTAGYWRAVVDGRGVVWALGSGRLIRYDPGSGATTSWSIDDDARIAADDIEPSGANGVWLVRAGALRHFDESGFRPAYDVGARVTAATEAPDGSVWAATVDGMLIRLAGGEQTRIDALAPGGDASIGAIAVDARGNAWCVWSAGTDPTRSWLARYDGSAWRVYERHAVWLGGPLIGLIALPDGEVWAATQAGVARFDGKRWTVPTIGASRVWPQALAAGLDGTAWVVAATVVGRFAGLAWRTFAPLGDVLPSDTVASVLPTQHGVLVLAGGALYRRAGDRWQQVLPTGATPSRTPADASALLAVSRDEAWVGGTNTSGSSMVWHFVGGAWSGLPTPVGSARQLLRTPDGALWAAAGDGTQPFVLRGTKWTTVGVLATNGLAVDLHGTVWVTEAGLGRAWSVHTYALDHGKWVERGQTASTDLVTWPAGIAVGHDATIWVGSPGFWGQAPGLVRYVNGAWRLIDPRGGSGHVPIFDLEVAPNGDVWVVGMDLPVAGEPGQSWVARFDGRSWAVFRPHLGLGPAAGDPATWYAGLDVGPDGTVWLATSIGLFRFDGRAWTVLYPGLSFSDVSVAGDGTVWVIGPSGVARLAAATTSR